MLPVHDVLMFVGLAVVVLTGVVVWSGRRARASRTTGLTGDDWAGRMLVWLLVLAAFTTGAFISYALLRP